MRKAKLAQQGKRRRPTRDRLKPQPKTGKESWKKRNRARKELQERYARQQAKAQEASQ